jgi:O-antigen/teichoic acid export membrane protein
MTRSTGKLRGLVGQTAVYGLADAVGKGLSLVLFPIFTRILTPAEYGAMEVIGTVTFLLSAVLVLGLDNATTRHYFAAEHRERQDIVLGTALIASGVSYFVGTLPFLLAHGLLTRILFRTLEFDSAVALALAGLPFTLLTAFSLQTFRRLLQPWPFAAFSIASLLLTISFNLLLVWQLRWGVRGVYASTLIASSVTAIGGLWFTRRYFKLHLDRRLLASLLRFGVPLVPAGLCLWGLSLVDRLFLVRLSTLTEVGLYSTANRLTSVLAFGVSAFQMAWGPFAFSISETEDARPAYANVLNYYLGWGGFGVLGLGLFAAEALSILTPPQYHGAAVAVPALAIGALAYGAYTLVAIGVNLANRTAQVSITLAGAALLNLLLCVLLIPRFGMLGAAYATALSWVGAAMHLSAVSQKAYWIPYDWKRAAAIVGMIIVCLLIGLFPLQSTESLLERETRKLAASLVYLIALKRWGLLPSLTGKWWLIRAQSSDA